MGDSIQSLLSGLGLMAHAGVSFRLSAESNCTNRTVSLRVWTTVRMRLGVSSRLGVISELPRPAGVASGEKLFVKAGVYT